MVVRLSPYLTGIQSPPRVLTVEFFTTALRIIQGCSIQMKFSECDYKNGKASKFNLNACKMSAASLTRRMTYSPSPTPSLTDLKPKVDNLNATLQEAVAVRLPKDAPGNFTTLGLATKD
jgi:hypothetical protein